MRIVLFSAILLFLFLQGCATNNSDLEYLEIVHEIKTCDPYCSVEYILLSNGMMLKKQSNTEDIIHHEIEFVKIDESVAKEVIESAKQNVFESLNERCYNCDEYTLFFNDKEKSFMYSVNAKNAPLFLKNIKDNLAQLFSSGVATDQFFIQFVYKRIGYNSLDYHIFPDGSVLKEEFAGVDYTLASSEIFLITPEKLNELNNSISEDFFDSQSNLEKCYTKGLEHGYVEILKNDSSKFIWTCGVMESEADLLFNKLLAEFG